MTPIEKQQKTDYDNRKIAEFEAAFRKENIRFNCTQWWKRGYKVPSGLTGRHYTYYCPNTGCLQNGWTYNIDQVERRACKHPLRRIKYGF